MDKKRQLAWKMQIRIQRKPLIINGGWHGTKGARLHPPIIGLEAFAIASLYSCYRRAIAPHSANDAASSIAESHRPSGGNEPFADAMMEDFRSRVKCFPRECWSNELCMTFGFFVIWLVSTSRTERSTSFGTDFDGRR